MTNIFAALLYGGPRSIASDSTQDLTIATHPLRGPMAALGLMDRGIGFPLWVGT